MRPSTMPRTLVIAFAMSVGLLCSVLDAGIISNWKHHARVSVDYEVRLNADETAHVVSFVGEYRW